MSLTVSDLSPESLMLLPFFSEVPVLSEAISREVHLSHKYLSYHDNLHHHQQKNKGNIKRNKIGVKFHVTNTPKWIILSKVTI